MKKLSTVFAVLALSLAGCTAPGTFDGYVHAECDPATAEKVTVCRSTQLPIPTVTQTVTPEVTTAAKPSPSPTATTTPAPTNLRMVAGTQTTSSFRVAWDAVTGATNYRVFKDNVFLADSSNTEESLTGLASGTSYLVGVSAIVGGVESARTNATFSTSGASPSPTPTPTPTPTTTTPPPTGGVPVAGNWTQTFNDDFNGTAVDTTKWRTNWYNEGGSMNNVGTYSRNATVANGELRMKLESSTAGALIHTDFTGGYRFPVGSYTEARIFFASSTDGQNLWNWPAWWVSSTAADGWPSSGEHDIAEVLTTNGLGKLTVNYHGPGSDIGKGAIPGTWGNSWHTYGIHRKAGSADVYWDGVKVASYATTDNGRAEILILNMGKSNSRPLMLGDANAMRVDYVKAWQPAP